MFEDGRRSDCHWPASSAQYSHQKAQIKVNNGIVGGLDVAVVSP